MIRSCHSQIVRCESQKLGTAYTIHHPERQSSSAAQEHGANASSPSLSATAPRGAPSEHENKPPALYSEALSSWSNGVVEQMPVCTELQSCNAECQDAYSTGTTSEEKMHENSLPSDSSIFGKWINRKKRILVKRINMIHILFPYC